MKNSIFLLFCIFTASCGGRVSHPVAATNEYDGRLSCDHLQAERSVNDSRILELTHERKQADVNNLGMLVVGPLFMDLSSSEKIEATALVKRDTVLDQLISAKCDSKVQRDAR